MFALADQATAANLKVGVGLMSRHAVALQELHDKISNGAIGDIVLMRGYRMHGPAGYSESVAKPAGMDDVEYQIRRFHSFLWASARLVQRLLHPSHRPPLLDEERLAGEPRRQLEGVTIKRLRTAYLSWTRISTTTRWSTRSAMVRNCSSMAVA